MENAGWQQMKINRSMSSSSAIISAASSEAVALNSNSCASSVCLPRNAMLRRIRSIAFLRPTLTSHARGLDGGSAAGQRSSAVANASCSASSARSKSPTRRISVASARPASSRNIFSISVGVMCSGNSIIVIPGRPQDEPGIHNHDREYGFRACASGRQLPTEGASRNDEWLISAVVKLVEVAHRLHDRLEIRSRVERVEQLGGVRQQHVRALDRDPDIVLWR